MKTTKQIALEKLGKLQDEQKHFNQELAKKAFKIFDTIPEVTKIGKDLENCENGEYTIEDDGMLAYRVEVPKDLRDLPFINDYLTQDYGYLTGKAHNDLWLNQCCGDFISVDWNHERDCYFVYDSATRKPIISKREEWMDERYVSAVIELYQNERGEFGDVVEVNSRYGYYENHFSLQGISAGIEVKDLKEIIASYEKQEDEEAV